MNELAEKTKNSIEEFLRNDTENQNMFVDCILVNPDTNETITIASDRYETTIMFAPHTNSENGYKSGYASIPEWEFNFDGYIFQELEKGYFVGYISDDMNYGIWNSLKELYPEDIDFKEGVQSYLQYCADNGITKKYLDEKTKLDTPDIMNFFDGIGLFQTMEYKGYIVEAGDLNVDNSKENIVDIYENQKAFENKEPIETISLNTIGLKKSVKDHIDEVYINTNTITLSEWQYKRDKEANYFVFVLGYDLLRNVINKYDVAECDINYGFCNSIIEKFFDSEEYKNYNYSGYDALSNWLNNNRETIEQEYRNFIGIKEKYGNMKIIDAGHRKEEAVALVEKDNGQYGTEYIIAFNYSTKNDKLNWGYGYYYDDNLNKAKNDFNKVIHGGNLSRTFDRNEDR